MNQPLESSSADRRLTPARAALLYAALALLGVLVSGAVLTLSVDDPVMQGRIELAKGLLFVLVTSILLYFLLKQWRDPVPVPNAPSASSIRSTSSPIRRWEDLPGKLPWQVLACVGLLALVPLVGFVVVKVNAPHAEREAYEDLQAIVDLKAEQVENWVAERESDALVIMAQAGLPEQVFDLQVPGGSKLEDKLRERLSMTMSAMKIEALSLIDAQGNSSWRWGRHDSCRRRRLYCCLGRWQAPDRSAVRSSSTPRVIALSTLSYRCSKRMQVSCSPWASWSYMYRSNASCFPISSAGRPPARAEKPCSSAAMAIRRSVSRTFAINRTMTLPNACP
ncbi:MAG: cache domain-containing protein [Propionivibrio sp.]|nr:cache domain-containing protein [Propionivibrio sp.]